MRAVAIGEDRRLEQVELDPLPLRDGDVRLQVSYCGICGSDLHYIDMPQLGPAGTVMGHELSGVVVERGAAVDGLAPGDRVAVLPFEYCGACAQCSRGLEHLCEHRMQTRLGGRNRRGAFAETVVTPAASAFPLPDALSDRDAALAEPFAVGLHAVAVADLRSDAPVAVLGGGPIGVMTCLALRAEGFARVVAIEANEQRRRRLEALGFAAVAAADAVYAVPARLGGAPAAVHDCSGHPSGLALALDLLPPRGMLVLVGYATEPVGLDTFHVVRDELRLRGAAMYSYADFARAIDRLAAGAVPCAEVITAVRPLSDAQACFDDLTSGSSEHLKVLLAP